MGGKYATDYFCDNGGFTTLGAACAILASCALVFGFVWALRGQSRSAGVQAVADSAVLAAQNEVAEFVIAVRVADASLLSMSLTGLSLVGVGAACCCVPPAAAVGKSLIETGKGILEKRDDMAGVAERTLATMQDALPAAAQAQAQSIIQENASSINASAVGYVELVPSRGEPLKVGGSQAARDAADAADANGDDIASAATEARQAREEADAALARGFLHDCGNAPGYCMYERADTVAGLPVSQNPLYHSANTWSFKVALERSQAYYPHRASVETPENDTVEEKARSALRTKFYEYAAVEVMKGYVFDDGESAPDIYFPLLPKNTSEMKGTSLYTDESYPVANGLLHAWDGCPGAQGAVSGTGSLADQDAGTYGHCPECGFDAVALGKVAAASSSIENGFEYHYRKVAEAAREYCDALGRAMPAESKAKDLSQEIFDFISEALEEMKGARIEAFPPGRYGSLCAIALEADTEGDVPFSSVAEDIGSFAAISSAVLAEDAEEDVISSLLDGLVDDIGPPLSDAGPAVLKLWSSMMKAYSSGTEGLCAGVRELLDSIPFVGATGLGTWASDALIEALEAAGLEPANIQAAKPFIANTEYVAQRGDGAVAQAIQTLKGVP